MLRTIVAQFDVHPYGSDFRHNPGNAGANPLAPNRDAWDMLPMFEMGVLYLNNGSRHDQPYNYPQRGDYLLDIHLICDTGRDPSWNQRDPRQFDLPMNCESRLALYIFVNKTDRDTETTNWRWTIWQTTRYPEHGQVLEHPQVQGVSIYGYEFNLIELFDTNTIIECVNQFKQKVKENLCFDVDERTFG